MRQAIGVRTLLRYLIGDRQAIQDLAGNRLTLWIGLAFVLSAGFAREYDGKDLLQEPWYLLLPFGVSLLSSLILFLIAFGQILFRPAPRPSFLSAYSSFLGLFWMTAPLAWLYAIPYERLLLSGNYFNANLATLGLVALWRVLLISRVIAVLMGYRFLAASFLVIVFADVAGLIVLFLTPIPIISVMGGIQLSAAESQLLFTTVALRIVGGVSLPVWLVGASILLANSNSRWQQPADNSNQPLSVSWGLAALAITSLAVWGIVLPGTQPEQRLRHLVEEKWQRGHIHAALAEMSAHEATAFPPHWDPPPWVGYADSKPPILDVMEVIIEQPSAPWVRSLYLDKFKQYLGDHAFGWGHLPLPEARRVIRVLQQLPEGPSLAVTYRSPLTYMGDRPDLSEGDKEILKILTKWSRGPDEPPPAKQEEGLAPR